MVGVVKFLTLLLLLDSTELWAQENVNFYRTLAEVHAPAIIQQAGRNPKADIPTRYDFDGDYFADNNWENLDHFDLEPLVYYEVIETQTHYFITYAFFHPRDFTNYFFCMPKLCHENDFEGAIVTVRKDSWMGQVEFVEALAHFSIKGTERPYSYLGNSRNLGGVVKRVVLRIESGGHGVHVWNGDYPIKYELYLPDDDSSTPRRGEAPIRYRLIPLDEIWNLTTLKSYDRVFAETYDFKNDRFEIKNLPRNLAGERYGNSAAHMPWAWTSTGSQRGEWFLDPALWVKRKLKSVKDFSLEYIRHPYLIGSAPRS